MPEEAIDTSLQSLATTTIRQYNSAYKQWWTFYEKNHKNPYDPKTTDVIGFLQRKITNSKLNYSSINTFRSALVLISSEDIGEDSRMKRFLKGVFRKNPPNRR